MKLLLIIALGLGISPFVLAANKPEPHQPPIIKFAPATKEQAEQAIRETKVWAGDIGKKMKIEFSSLETDHFLIFTDWDPREFAFLKENVENAYAAVSRQLDMPVKQNVFIGKLPIMMFKLRGDFEKFAKENDHLDAKKMAGYFGGTSDGFGHMAMWKPDVNAARGDVSVAERQWAYVLTHEFTHAFVSRYRTNVFIPRWLGEGVAEVIAYGQFYQSGVHYFVKRLKGSGKGIIEIFDHKEIGSFTAGDYPVAQTVVETLIVGDQKAFLHYFNDIKDGMDPDDALKKYYRTDRYGLEQAWKKYVDQLPIN